MATLEPSHLARVETFAATVRRIAAWAHSPEADKHSDMLKGQELLAELHLNAVLLPALDCGDEVEGEQPSRAEEAAVLDRFSKLAFDEYWDVFNPLDRSDRVAIANSLACDLTEIWQDLRTGLSLYESGHFLEALWEWRFGFESHWGRHLLSAQKAIHACISGG